MASDIYFQVMAVNGVLVRTSCAYWDRIVTLKHPAMAGKEEMVKLTLSEPEEIRQSLQNQNVLLYYRRQGAYHCCVVVRKLNGDGFIVTAYLTDRVKEGTGLWRR